MMTAPDNPTPMWSGTWSADGSLYTGTYTTAVGEIWIGTVSVVDALAGRYKWVGVWHTSAGPV